MIYRRRPEEEGDPLEKYLAPPAPQAAEVPPPVTVVPPPAAVPVPERYEPAVAKIAKPAPVHKDELPEPRRQSFLESALNMAPALVAGIGHMTKGGNAQTREMALGHLQEGTAKNAAADARYEAAKKNQVTYANAQRDKAAAAERQAKMDSLAFSKDQRESAKDVREQTTFSNAQVDRAEDRDPNSQKNMAYKAQLQKAYPELWASMSEEERANQTVRNAPELALRQADRAQKNADEKSRITHQQHEELRFTERLPGDGWGGGTYVGPTPNTPKTPTQIAEEAYGGADKVPVTVRADAELVEEMQRRGHRDTHTAFKSFTDDIRADQARAAGKTKNAPPSGFEVADEGAWSRALQDSGGRRKVEGVAAAVGARDVIRQMRELRAKHGVEFFDSDAKTNFAANRKLLIGQLNAMANAGVLNAGEAEQWAQVLSEMGPTLMDAQRVVGKGDPLLAQLDGLDKVLEQSTANNAGAVGLRHSGGTVSQRNQGNQPRGKSLSESRAGGDEIIQVRKADGSTRQIYRKNLDKAREQGWSE